jgi:hypothetical protein
MTDAISNGNDLSIATQAASAIVRAFTQQQRKGKEEPATTLDSYFINKR